MSVQPLAYPAFLGLESLHVFITGAAGGIGKQAVREFLGLHGYAHEGAYQLTVEQERDVLTRCIDIATKLTGKKPVGYRAPLYQLRESTLDLLEEYGFEYVQKQTLP
ncbi:hypothetical protein APSETT444_008460 [Aspergillus pseudonomiae]